MKITTEQSLSNFNFWSGAKDNAAVERLFGDCMEELQEIAQTVALMEFCTKC